MNGRIYDPLLGRFLSADVLVENPANLQTYNRYSYVRNNPLSLTDPSGFMTADEHRNEVERLREEQKAATAAYVKSQGGPVKALVKALFGQTGRTAEGKAWREGNAARDKAIQGHLNAAARIEWAAAFHNFMVSGAEKYQGRDLSWLRVDVSKIDDEAADTGDMPHQTLLMNGDMAAAVVDMHVGQAAGAGGGALLGRLGRAEALAKELSAVDNLRRPRLQKVSLQLLERLAP